MIPNARIKQIYQTEKSRLAATNEANHQTIRAGVWSIVQGELRELHGRDGSLVAVSEEAAVAIRDAGLWRDPAMPRGSRAMAAILPKTPPFRCPFLFPGLEIPDDFPAETFEAAYEHALPDIVRAEQFCGAWIGILFRFKACGENEVECGRLIREHGSNPPPSHSFAQDREMFEFHSNGYAALDCLAYAMYFTAELVKPAEFPVRKLRDIKAMQTAEAFRRHFPGDPLSIAIDDTFDSEDYNDWGELRNVLAHRIATGRTIYASTVGSKTQPPPNQWTSARASSRSGRIPRTLPPLEITESGLTPRRRWLAERLTVVLSAAHRFIATNL